MRYDAIYARQSREKDGSLSIEQQIETCKKKCGKNIKIFDKDEGWSGKDTDRPDLQRLIQEVQAGIIKKVVVYKIDRLSRNVQDFYELWNMFSKYDCDVISATQDLDTTTSLGRAMVGMLAIFAQMERENIQARIKDNFYYRIQDGRWAVGSVPFGYRLIHDEQKRPQLDPQPDELKEVKKVLMMYAEDNTCSIWKIHSQIIEDGFTGRDGKMFSHEKLRRMLMNPIYAKADDVLYEYLKTKGVNFLNKKEEYDGSRAVNVVGKGGTHHMFDEVGLNGATAYLCNAKGVISSRYYIIIQKRMRENQTNRPIVAKKNLMEEYSGFLKCATCGYMIGMRKKPTLSCSRSPRILCNTSYAGVRLENIRELAEKEIQIKINELHVKVQEKIKKRAKIKKKIDKLQQEKTNYLNLLGKSETLDEELTDRILELQKKIDKEQLKLKVDIDSRDIIEIRTGINTKNILYSQLTKEQKRTVLTVLIEKIIVQPDGKIEIIWKEEEEI